MVAKGLTNREVAAALFVTPRTVESNLTKICTKLGVRSRSELVHRLATRVVPNRMEFLAKPRGFHVSPRGARA